MSQICQISQTCQIFGTFGTFGMTVLNFAQPLADLELNYAG